MFCVDIELSKSNLPQSIRSLVHFLSSNSIHKLILKLRNSLNYLGECFKGNPSCLRIEMKWNTCKVKIILAIHVRCSQSSTVLHVGPNSKTRQKWDSKKKSWNWLKYGFCNKSFWKDLTSWTLFSTCLSSLLGVFAITPSKPTQKWWQICWKKCSTCQRFIFPKWLLTKFIL